MMQIKGAKSENTERYARALGLKKGSKNTNTGSLKETLGMMPSERAAIERKKEDARLLKLGNMPTIHGKTFEKGYLQDDEGPQQNAMDDKGENDSDLEDEDNDDEFMKAYRAKRTAELKAEQNKTLKYKHAGQGKYNEIKEDEFLNTLNGSRHCVVHFYSSEFETCKIMDLHLGIIAKNHLETKIVKMDVNKAPFFTSKLQIRTLPTVVTFLEGVSKTRLVGFDDLGGHENFKTASLETWLRKRGMIKKTEQNEDDEEETREQELARLANPIRVNEFDEHY